MLSRWSRGLVLLLFVSLISLAVAQTEPVAEIEVDGITLRVTGVEFREGEAAERVFAVIYGELSADGRECAYGHDFALVLDGEAFQPDGGLMSRLQSSIQPRRDYPGSMFGHCFTDSAPTYLVFDVPAVAETVQLSHRSETVELPVVWTGVIATLTPTPTVTPSLTNTPRPTNTPSLTPTPRPTRTPSLTPTARTTGESYTTVAQARLRGCSSTSCEIVVTLSGGTVVTVTGQEDGESVSGSRVWRAVRLTDGRTGFIHSSLLQRGVVSIAPVVAPPSSNNSGGGGGGGSNTSQPPPSTSVPPAQPQWVCGGDQYNCSDFRNRTELMSYFNTCPGDPSKLDGNNDGVPCESLR